MMKTTQNIVSFFLILLFSSFLIGCDTKTEPTNNEETPTISPTISPINTSRAENTIEAQLIPDEEVAKLIQEGESLEETVKKDFEAAMKKAVALENTDPEAASVFLQSLTVDYPNRYEPYHHLALYFAYVENDHEAAIALYEEALRKSPKDALFYDDFGTYLYQTKDYERALVMFQKAENLDTNDQSRLLCYALTITKLERFDEAFTYFQKQFNGNSAKSYLCIAEAVFVHAQDDHTAGQKEQAFNEAQLAQEYIQKSLALDPTSEVGLQLKKHVDEFIQKTLKK